MAHSQLGKSIEEVVREYAAAKKAIEEDSRFAHVDGKFVPSGEGGEMDVMMDRYWRAWEKLRSHGIKVDSVVHAMDKQNGVDNFSSVELMKTETTWPKGRWALEVACIADAASSGYDIHPTVLVARKKYFRPFTIEENMRARLLNWELGRILNDSCASITYGPKGRFKITLVSLALLRLPLDFDNDFTLVNYDSLQADDVIVKEFDRDNGIYDRGLKRTEALNQEVWQFVARDTLAPYVARQWQGQLESYTAMVVYLCPNPQVGETRPLCVSNLNYSNLGAGSSLSSYGIFARIRPDSSQASRK